MNHYEALGVKEDATPAAIKQAYRAKAKEKHPDKGGDQAEFQPVVRAYEVLSNPERRLLYDSTGQDQRKPIDVEVQSYLTQAFAHALSSPEDIELTAFVRNAVTALLESLPAQFKELSDRKKKLTAKRQKIKSSGAINIVHLIIDGELKNIEAQTAHLNHQTEVANAVLVALDEYSEDWTAPPERKRGIYFYGASTAGTGSNW